MQVILRKSLPAEVLQKLRVLLEQLLVLQPDGHGSVPEPLTEKQLAQFDGFWALSEERNHAHIRVDSVPCLWSLAKVHEHVWRFQTTFTWVVEQTRAWLYSDSFCPVITSVNSWSCPAELRVAFWKNQHMYVLGKGTYGQRWLDKFLASVSSFWEWWGAAPFSGACMWCPSLLRLSSRFYCRSFIESSGYTTASAVHETAASQNWLWILNCIDAFKFLFRHFALGFLLLSESELNTNSLVRRWHYIMVK